MSCMCCHYCSRVVDTDFDCDSLYVIGHDNKCVCEWCREEKDLRTEFDEPEASIAAQNKLASESEIA